MTYIRDRIEWALCWACYRLALALPHTSGPFRACLPYAGVYAHTGGFAEYRAGRTGFANMSGRARA